MLIDRWIDFALRRPRTIFVAIALITGLAVAQFVKVTIDTDPENMLSAKEAVRVFHHDTKREFGLYDYVVVGVVNETDPAGVFNPQTLANVYTLSSQIKDIEGVIGYELMSLANKDDIEQAGQGALSFQWLMKHPPYTAADAQRIQARAMANPLFYNTLISQDGKALCIYVPIKAKNISYRVAKAIRSRISVLKGTDQYYLTGLPLAEDAFGTEMFLQMGISAPLAILVIFLLMWLFFRHVRLVVMPLIMAGIVVLITMGLLAGLGFPIHIMSSMIPIFLLPIAVLDSIHILNEFFEKYRGFKDKNRTIKHVLTELFWPNLFTSLTTVAGFLSLSFAPIPPVQVFGVFVALGVAIAWVLTILLIPAYIAVLKEKDLGAFGATEEHLEGGMSGLLMAFGRFTLRRWRAILIGTVALSLVSVYGITKIQINDNPTKWFALRHPIRISDIVLNRHFGGTYSAYLIIEAADKEARVFQDPAMLRYIGELQEYLQREGIVGKSTSLADVTKKVYYELLGGDTANNVIPPTRAAVAQCLLSFESSHKPDDLWHFVTPDYGKLNVWLQLRSGDNRDMPRVVRQVKRFFAQHPPPENVSYRWAGLTYINMVWQDKMVGGMFVNFLGSFFIVLYMMVLLFRSPFTGIISMIPLSATVLFIYSTLGFLHRDYDMPVAVLSALTLGLAIDFAIHFIQRARELYRERPDWPAVCALMFQAPARALLKNALVVSIGFLPLFVSPLVPYNTVGFFMFMIMLVASIGTLLILPAVITAFPSLVFDEGRPGRIACSCGRCMLMGVIIALTIVYVLLGYDLTRWNTATLIALGTVVLISGGCAVVSRSAKCTGTKK